MKHSGIDVLMREIEAWQAETFPRATPQSCANHLLSEATELKNAPRDPREMADVFMLLIGCANAAGVDLASAAREKLEENRERTWGAENSQGFIEHVKPESENAASDSAFLDRLESVFSAAMMVVAREVLAIEEHGEKITELTYHEPFGEWCDKAGFEHVDTNAPLPEQLYRMAAVCVTEAMRLEQEKAIKTLSKL